MALTYQINIANKVFPADNNKPTTVINDLSLTITAGEFVSLLGPSGAGKSTLLNILAGLDKDYQGSVQLTTLTGAPARVSLMFQESRLMPWLTVSENVKLVCQGSDTERCETALSWLHKVGLEGSANLFPAQLSGGMLKRAALARAFACEPDILLMDEPFSSLDINAADSLRALLIDLWQARRLTVVYVTHDITEALLLSDRVVLLRSNPMKLKQDVPITLSRPRNPQTTELLALVNSFKQTLAHPA